MDAPEQRKQRASRRFAIAETLSNLVFLLAVGLVVWIWLGTDLRFIWRLGLTSVVAFGLGVCRSVLRDRFPDPRQDPSGQGLGAVYPLLFWTAVSVGLALWAVGWAIAR
jgi:hypothetical protein